MTCMPNICHYPGEITGYLLFVDDQHHCILGRSFMFSLKSWDRSVSIVAVQWAVDSRAQFLAVKVIFIFFRLSVPVLGPTQPLFRRY